MVSILSALWCIRGLWKLPDGRDWLKGKLGLVLMCRAVLSKSYSDFLLMGGAVFPPSCLTWGQTMVEVMKKMEASSQRSHARTAELSALDCAAGHHWHTPLLETPGHSRASLGQSLVGSLILSPGSWCTQGFVCASKSLFPWSCVSPGGSLVGLMVTSSKTAYAISRSAAPRVHTPRTGHSWYVPLNETLKHSRACLASLCGDSLCA